MRRIRIFVTFLLMTGLLPWCGITSAWAASVEGDPPAVLATAASGASVYGDAVIVEARADRVVSKVSSPKQPRFAVFSSLHCSGVAAVLPAGFRLMQEQTAQAVSLDRSRSMPGLSRAPPWLPPRFF